MAVEDRATDEEELEIALKIERIIESARDWDLTSKHYLREVLDQIGLMISYRNANGDLMLDRHSWDRLLDAKVIIPRINEVLRSELDITVSTEFSSSLKRLWFEEGWVARDEFDRGLAICAAIGFPLAVNLEVKTAEAVTPKSIPFREF
jgi:hypothetical protein